MSLSKSTTSDISLTKNALDTYIAEIASGSRDAVGALYEETKTAVYGFALSILRNPYDAEDILQDTYIRIWSAAEDYEPLGKPMAWILTITRNLALSRLRERSRAVELSDEGWLTIPAENVICCTEDRLVLRAAMKLLTREERHVIILHSVSGLKHIEIARLLSKPLPTVLSKYSRARKKLLNALKEGDQIENRH